MKMKNDDVIKDALRLANKILRSMDPDEKSTIVNIVFDKKGKDTVLKGKYSSIPKALGYVHDKTPGFLEKHEVIEGKASGWWFVGYKNINSLWASKLRPVDLNMDDNITGIAQKKRYIKDDQVVEYYFHFPEDDIGPRLHGQIAVFVNRHMLGKFIKKFSKILRFQVPADRDYWYENNQLQFKLTDGSVDGFDFSKAKVSLKMFEAFYALWKKDGKGSYKPEDILLTYKKIFSEELLARRIGEIVSNVRSTIINKKPLISNKIEWKFDRKNKCWIFKIAS